MNTKDNKYLTEQIITYIGNKRLLLSEISKTIDDILIELNKECSNVNALDLFSGSGIVSRLFKEYGFKVIANDLETYSAVINKCYLSNNCEFNEDEYNKYYRELESILTSGLITGIISSNYAPKDDSNIQAGERVFYTKNNAQIIDTINKFIQSLPEELKKFFLAPLLYEASVHTNTSGVFKGFYKDSATGIGKFGGDGENALVRIKGKVELKKPILSTKVNDYTIYQKDANELAGDLEDIDIAYLDPPYNQHPYGSNYFMLNVITNNKLPADISSVSGIPKKWNRSNFNKKQHALSSLEDIVNKLKTKYIIISYNNEGFISYDDMKAMLERYGDLSIKEIDYSAFKASRNLKDRSKRVTEYLFILKKSK